MSNYKRGHRATSIGTQLLSNYRKYLAAYERAWASVDLPEHPLQPVSCSSCFPETKLCVCICLRSVRCGIALHGMLSLK